MLWGLLWSAQQVAYSRLGARPISIGTGLLLQMPLAVVWALITPAIVWLGRCWPLEGSRRFLHGAGHLVVSTLVVYALAVFYAGNVELVRGVPPDAPPLLQRALRLFLVWVLSDALLYWAVLVVDYGVRQYRAARVEELHAAQLETELVQADLQALKMQLHPHFLFNALHTIGSLVRTGDRETAVRVVAGLGDLLRRVLDGAAQQEVPLKQELEFIGNYLDIEQVRFRDRLKVVINVAPDVLDAKVPHLILQPLVENAIRHGIGPHVRAGCLIIGARRLDDRLQLVVRDDGPGIGTGEGEAVRPGIGLSNTRARLTRLYGADYELEVANAPEGGVEARLALPFSLAPAKWEPSVTEEWSNGADSHPDR
jgi:signal transduction histidine kinase